MTMTPKKTPSTELMLGLDTVTPVAALSDDVAYKALIARIREEVEKFEPDVSTEAGRKEIASMAFKVARTKTAIDAAGKELNESARAQINAVDAQRRKIRGELEALQAEVRKPLDDWEAAEKHRIEMSVVFFKFIEQTAEMPRGITSGEIREKIALIDGLTFDPDILRSHTKEAEGKIQEARISLGEALVETLQSEHDQRELEQLRAEREAAEAARKRADEEAQRRREAEVAALEAERETQRREQAAAEAAAQEEKRKAAAALAKVEAEKQALIREQEQAEAQRILAAQREAEEQERRERNARHRNKVLREVRTGVEKAMREDRTADSIVQAIVDGKVPHVRIEF